MGGTGLLGCEDAKFLYSLPRGFRLVVDACAVPVGAGGVTGGILRRGGEVYPRRGQWPQLAQQRKFFSGVMPPVERVLAHDMDILRFHLRSNPRGLSIPKV